MGAASCRRRAQEDGNVATATARGAKKGGGVDADNVSLQDGSRQVGAPALAPAGAGETSGEGPKAEPVDASAVTFVRPVVSNPFIVLPSSTGGGGAP